MKNSYSEPSEIFDEDNVSCGLLGVRAKANVYLFYFFYYKYCIMILCCFVEADRWLILGKVDIVFKEKEEVILIFISKDTAF